MHRHCDCRQRLMNHRYVPFMCMLQMLVKISCQLLIDTLNSLNSRFQQYFHLRTWPKKMRAIELKKLKFYIVSIFLHVDTATILLYI